MKKKPKTERQEIEHAFRKILVLLEKHKNIQLRMAKKALKKTTESKSPAPRHHPDFYLGSASAYHECYEVVAEELQWLGMEELV